MSKVNLSRYLELFAERAEAAGLSPKKPGANWCALHNLVPGSHLSLSVRRDRIEVNLNMERDADRALFRRLSDERTVISKEIGATLIWEAKDGVKKTAIRSQLERGYEDEASWDEQHAWAIDMLQRFERAFENRLQSIFVLNGALDADC